MTTDWFKKEAKKEKLNLFKKGKKVDMELPKDMKNILILAGGTVLLSEAVEMMN